MIRRYVVSLGGRAGGAAFQALVYILLTRLLTPEEYGVFMAVSSAILVAFGFIDFGMTIRFLRAPADREAPRAYGFALLSRIVSLTALGAGLLFLVVSTGGSTSSALIAAAAAYAVGESFGEASVSAFQGQKRSWAASVAVLSRRGIALAMLSLAPTAEGLAAATTASFILGCASLALAIIPRAARPLSISTVVRSNYPYALASAGPQVAQLDSTVVALTASAELAGLYAPAAKLLNPLNLAIMSMMQVFVPELASKQDRDERMTLFRKARKVVLLGAAIAAAASWFSPWLAPVIFGEAYADSAPMIAAAFVAAALSGIAQLHLAWFYGGKLGTTVPVLMLMSSALGLAMMGVLGPYFGVWGLAISFVTMHASVCCVVVTAWFLDVRRR